MSMLYCRKNVASENPDGKLVVEDVVMTLVPCKSYSHQQAIVLIAPKPGDHIMGYKTVMKNFDIENVSLVLKDMVCLRNLHFLEW